MLVLCELDQDPEDNNKILSFYCSRRPESREPDLADQLPDINKIKCFVFVFSILCKVVETSVKLAKGTSQGGAK